MKETANVDIELIEEVTAGKVELEKIDDQFCTDYVYELKKTKSVGIQTLESGTLPTTPS